MTRKLASVQRVLEIRPIEGADFIEVAQIQGWQCIVKKGEFNPGDLAVYLEIDSVPPTTPVFEFLWAPLVAPTSSFRIRTKKLRGVVSQGLLLPTHSFPELDSKLSGFLEGDDLTELLGVKKYELPQKLPGIRSGASPYGAFAADVPKTDEERLQSSIGLLREMEGLPYVITEKCDGASATYTFDRDMVFRVYSRNWEVKPGDNPYCIAARHVEQALRYARAHGHDWALQAEVCGPNIQKNRLDLERFELRAFNLFDKDAQAHLPPDKLFDFCRAWSIPLCQELDRGTSFGYSLADLLQMAEGRYDGTKNEREGIVVRPLEPRHSQILGSRLSFKVISNRYLLRGGEDD